MHRADRHLVHADRAILASNRDKVRVRPVSDTQHPGLLLSHRVQLDALVGVDATLAVRAGYE